MKIAPVSIEEILKITQGTVDDKFLSTIIDDISSLSNAIETSISFFTGVSAYNEALSSTKAKACFTKKEDVQKLPNSIISIIVSNPYLAITQIVHNYIGDGEKYPTEFLSNEEKPNGISPLAVVSKCAKIGKNVTILPNAYVGANVEIQDNVTIHAHASVEHCVIGTGSIIRSGARIGCMGFGFVPNMKDGHHLLVPQISKVILGECVDVGANTCIDRGFLTDTKIGSHTKFDNLCHIAHGVEIGESCFFAGCAAVAGGVKIGNFCMIGGNSSIAGNVMIANFTQVFGMSGVAKHVFEEKQTIAGIPATSSMDWKRMHIKMMKDIKKKS